MGTERYTSFFTMTRRKEHEDKATISVHAVYVSTFGMRFRDIRNDLHRSRPALVNVAHCRRNGNSDLCSQPSGLGFDSLSTAPLVPAHSWRLSPSGDLQADARIPFWGVPKGLRPALGGAQAVVAGGKLLQRGGEGVV